MKQARLDQLSDGIFAIIITLLTFELKLPYLGEQVSDMMLLNALQKLWPIFVSFVLSFAVLFTYWRAHHYIVSVYAKTIDVRLTSINAVFFFFISLIPFSARLLGEYHYARVPIIVYALNIIFIGLSLLWMRHHVLTSKYMEHSAPSTDELQRGVIRTLVPVFCAAGAIALSFWNIALAIVLLTFAILFNLFSRTSHFINWGIEKVTHEKIEEKNIDNDLAI